MEQPNQNQQQQENNQSQNQQAGAAQGQQQAGASNQSQAQSQNQQASGGDDKDKEIARLKQENETFKQKETEAEAKRQETERKTLEDQGNWKKLYEEEKTKRETAEKDLTSFKRDVEAVEAATEAGFGDKAKEVAKRLVGSTKSEMLADARGLATIMNLGSTQGQGQQSNPTAGANPATPGAGGAGAAKPGQQNQTSGKLEPRPVNIRF